MSKIGFSWRMVSRPLWVRPGRYALMFFSLALGTSVVVAILSLTLDIEAKMNKELRDYGPNLLVTPMQNGPSDADTLPAEFMTRVEDVAGRNLLAFAPLLYRVGDVNGQTVVLVGSEMNALSRLYPSWRWEWKNGRRVVDPESCAVGRQLAERLRVQTGGEVSVRFRDAVKRFPVAAILTTGDVEESQLFLPLSAAQTLTGARGRLSAGALSVLGRFEDVSRLGRRIEEAWPGSEARPVRKVAVAEGMLLNKVKLMMTIFVAVILLITSLSVGTALSAAIAGRRAEFGLLKAIGAADGSIIGIVLSQAALLSFLAGAIGYATGIAMTQVLGRVLFNSLITPRWQTVPAAILVTMAIGAASFIIPTRRALAVNPAAVLKGE